METVSSEYFHGTNGDNILNIIEKGQIFGQESKNLFGKILMGVLHDAWT